MGVQYPPFTQNLMKACLWDVKKKKKAIFYLAMHWQD